MNFRWKVAQTFERIWWKRYLKRKDTESYLKWKKSYWHDFLQNLSLEVPLNQRVFDAGCGPAGIFTIMEGNSVTALDPLLDSYDDLNHFDRTWYPEVTFVNEPLENFESKAISTVYCINVINHVADLSQSLKQLALLTEPSGTLIISTDCHRSGFNKRLFRSLQWDILHPHQLDFTDFRSHLNEAGFEIVKEPSRRHDAFFDYVVVVCRKVAE